MDTVDISDKAENLLPAVEAAPIIVLPAVSANGVSNGKTVNHGKKADKCSEAENRKQRIVDISVTEELLGSVTTFATNNKGPESSHAVRTSARVIHKMRMDSIRPTSPTPSQNDKKDATLNPLPKTPSQTKTHVRVQWSNIEKQFFFDALNEFGRDFEAMSNYINHKVKRKSPNEPDHKTKDHVRQLYYQLYQKASKYLVFSDDVRKNAQELYTLINYGEMKKKMLSLNNKSFLKMRDLVYKGSVTIRARGKNIKIKTPSCRALRKLNQLEGSLEDVQLPSRVEVVLRPTSMESWGKVQSLAQNPRLRAALPLHRRVACLLQAIQQKWRGQNVRLYEKYVIQPIQQHGKQKLTNEIIDKSEQDLRELKSMEPLLCFAPPKDVVIHRPMIQLNEFLSSYNICLNSYEQRIGAKTLGERLSAERVSQIKENMKNSKRVRHNSESEKISSPDNKKSKIISENATPNVLPMVLEKKHENAQELEGQGNDSNESLKIKREDTADSESENLATKIKFDEVEPVIQIKIEMAENDIPVVNDAIICDTKNSSTIAIKSTKPKRHRDPTHRPNTNAFKPLISDEALKQVREGWSLKNVGDLTVGDLYLMFGTDSKLVLEYHWTDLEPEEGEEVEEPGKNIIGNKLKQLLTMASLLDRNKNNCSCGKGNKLNDQQNENGLFKQPTIPIRGTLNDVTFRPNPNNPRLRQNRLWRTRNQRPRSVVVTRLLPLQPGIPQSYDDLVMNNNNNIRNNNVIHLDFSNNSNQDVAVSHSENPKVEREKLSDILETKISKLSNQPSTSQESSNVQNFSETSRSSIKSLLECLSGINNESDVPDNLADMDSLSISPIKLLGESLSDGFMDSKLDDISLSSFLGRLDSAYHSKRPRTNDDFGNLSIITESSIDYVSRFEDIAAEMRMQENNGHANFN